MTEIPFQGVWPLAFEQPGTGKRNSIPAQVPGNALADIVRASLMPDPFYGSNSLEFRKFDCIVFKYISTFTAPAIEAGDKLALVFEGVGTVAEYYLDGQLIGQSCNMFVKQALDITDLTSPGQTYTLEVVLKSPANYARQFTVPAHARAQDYNCETLYLRKARHSFGWDIFPRLVGGNSSAVLMCYDHPPKAMPIVMLKWDNGNKTYYNHVLLGNVPYDYELYCRCMTKIC